MNNRELRYLKGIGPKRAEALEKIGIKTITDLLDFFPRRYIDRTTLLNLNELSTGDTEVTVFGKIEALGTRGGGRRRRRMFYIVISDGKGILEAVWFNYADYYKTLFTMGDWVALSGKISFYRQYQMVHPDFDLIADGELTHTGKIIPIYPGSEALRKSGITSKILRKITTQVFDIYIDKISETLPAGILKKYKYPERKTAYVNMHFPESMQLLETSSSRLKYEEFFFLQLMLALQRKYNKTSQPGYAFSMASQKLPEMLNGLPFELTPAQKKAIKEIRADMKKAHPMNRLLQGDVGSGKTLVALMAILIALDNGYQAALMVPTEILAEQHYLTVTKMLSGLGVETRVLTSATGNKEREKILDLMNSEEACLLIGTHALIQEDVTFARLGLVVIDEQHRFGVMQRAQLQEKGIDADVLVMTATPIPRTLALTVYGNLDVSTIDQLPPGRRPVKTVWRTDETEKKIYTFIRDKIAEGAQVFIVFPLVEESEKIDLKAATESYEKFRGTYFSGFESALIHGRMKSAEKDDIMKQFAEGKIRVLVSTTVIEVGVDVPSASIMLIEHAERFGLSQLHQLRGRVGRGKQKSYCILKTPKNIGEVARARMEIMCTTTDGFRIAEEDMKLRGWGDFYGTKQHGLPDFNLANPVFDRQLLNTARRDAFDLVESDPQLRVKDNLPVKSHFMAKFADRLHLVRIG